MTTEISQNEKPKTFLKSKEVAKRGGKVAEDARISAERELERPVTSKENYFSISGKKLIKKKKKKDKT